MTCLVVGDAGRETEETESGVYVLYVEGTVSKFSLLAKLVFSMSFIVIGFTLRNHMLILVVPRTWN